MQAREYHNTLLKQGTLHKSKSSWLWQAYVKAWLNLHINGKRPNLSLCSAVTMHFWVRDLLRIKSIHPPRKCPLSAAVQDGTAAVQEVGNEEVVVHMLIMDRSAHTPCQWYAVLSTDNAKNGQQWIDQLNSKGLQSLCMTLSLSYIASWHGAMKGTWVSPHEVESLIFSLS